jgi:hypothetical protein
MDIIQGKLPIHPIFTTQLVNILPDWATHFLSSHDNLRAYLPYVGQAYGYANTLKSYLLPLIDQVSRKPDLATVALLVIILFVSLKILNMLYQTFVFWLRMAWRIVFWASLAALALWMYHRGPEGAVEDVGYWWNVWNQDYDYWRERERVARMMKQGQGRRTGGWF